MIFPRKPIPAPSELLSQKRALEDAEIVDSLLIKKAKQEEADSDNIMNDIK